MKRAVVLCVFSERVSERASVNVGKRLHTSQVYQPAKKESLSYKSRLSVKNTMKGEREQKTDPVPAETHRNQDQEMEEKDPSVWDRRVRG